MSTGINSPAEEKHAVRSAAVFMSGVGSNAEVLLRLAASRPSEFYKIALIVTDAPRTSRAAELARQYNVPLAALDIREFYRSCGLDTISLATEAGRETREKWTERLRELIAPCNIDFGIMAGFVPLSNITSDFPCLNVHPADLTIRNADGSPELAGLHILPVEKALCNGYQELRSSVIIAQPFTGNAQSEIDSGPVLGISTPVRPELEGHSAAELCAVRDARPGGKRPKEGDLLSRLACCNIEKLKVCGDHVVFPQVIEAFAAGCYREHGGRLFFRRNRGEEYAEVKTVEFGTDTVRPVKL